MGPEWEEVKKKINPNHRFAPMVGVIFGGGIICSIGKITCEKCSKSRMGEEVKKKLTQPSDAVNST